MRDIKFLSAMVDVSRNAVLKKEEVKKFMVALKKMGYNSFALYSEDLYELPNYKMFGYLRGKYSIEDLKEFVAFGEEIGITLIPSIEVLAHVEHIFRWREFKNVHDCRNILLAGEEKTYELIEAMVKTMREIYKTDYIMLGCDEAANLGLGQYLKKHGYTDPKVIMKEHLTRCVEIAHKYGFTPRLSGDMFFSLAGAQYTDNPDIITPEIVDMFPKGACFGYWDYFSPRRIIEPMFTACKKFGAEIAFTASVCSWTGFSPHNHRAFATNMESLPVAHKEDIQRINITHWGDDGGECSVWASLPAWFYCAQLARGETDIELIKKRFFDIFGISFDDFSKLDYPIDYKGELNRFYSEKPMLYNDPFLGVYDNLVDNAEERTQRFIDHANELFEIKERAGEFAYLFDMAAKLCLVMAIKHDLGVRTRNAYKSGDKEALKAVANDYTTAHDRLCDFYESFRYVWHKERKGNGFEVQTVRLGGLKQRLLDCQKRLIDYANGELESIEELEEDIIDIPDINDSHCLKENKYGKIVTVGSLSHFNFFGI